ncbi:MAG: 30S ribosomal protein S16 [Chlamydiae bacterium]|nr:30S ribosomal protein S16 [Chlamydiota bacterium]
MALKIRLRQYGRNNRQTFRLVVMDIREKRDGKYIEKLGWYDPLLKEKNMEVNGDRVTHWLNLGAEMSHDAKTIISKSAPSVIKEWNEKRRVKNLKRIAQRRALRRARSKVPKVKEMAKGK